MRTLTPERMTAYLLATKGNYKEAIHLYEQNTRKSESLFGVIRGLEIAFRNACHTTLSLRTGNYDWYDKLKFDQNEREAINEAKSNLTRWGKTITPGRVVSELTFGFWVRLLSPQYEKRLWVPHLHRSFSGMPKKDRMIAFDRMEEIRKLRNRIAHHEPIFNRNLPDDYSKIIEALNWICPVTACWVQNTNTFVLI